METPRQTLEKETAARLQAMLRVRVGASRKVTTGYGATERWLIDTDGGQRYFVKVGVTPPSIDALRHEIRVYEKMRLPCMPALVASQDDERRPILILEDLSNLEWPPPWSNRTIALALDAIREVHASHAPLPSYAARNGSAWDWWRMVERTPEPFLGLGVVSPTWLSSHLPVLIERAASVDPTGDAVAHFDLRSDNLCFSANAARVVDWSLACLGNPRLDLGLFLPGLADEHGVHPESVLPNEPGIAAWVAGFFASHASKPFIPSAPGVRKLQLRLLRAALPWAIRELGLAPTG